MTFVRCAALSRRLVLRSGSCWAALAAAIPAMAASGEPTSDVSAVVARALPAIVTVLVNRPSALPTSLQHQGLEAARGQRQAAGFVVGEDGFIVTNWHVVQMAGPLVVQTQDGRTLDAALVGADPLTDLALLRVAPTAGLPALAFVMEPPPLGATVIAIGDPFGYAASVSVGVVSGLERPYDSVDPVGFIQHDAALNPGSSGGPLLDTTGRVAGVNTAIVDAAPYNVGIGFAVPAQLVASVVAALRTEGHVARPYLGVEVQTLETPLARSLGTDGPGGLLVAHVHPGSPADGQLRPGDVLQAADGRPLAHVRDLPRALMPRQAGDTIHLTVQRDGVADVAVVLGASPPPIASRRPSPGADAAGNDAHGIRARNLEPLGIRFDRTTPEGSNGLVLATPPVGSAAHRAGLRAGDRLLAIDRETVTTTARAASLLQPTSRPVALLVQRGAESPRYLALGGGAGHRGNVAAPVGGPY
ncbi:MAG: trypsin-like peptidase domain-containing protein [Pseudomonadota bacterium]